MKSIIVDGNNLGWMAYGMVPLTYDDQRVDAIYVGLNMILSYLRQFEPDKFCVVWDSARDAERMKLYPNYKRSHKELTPDEKAERDNFFAQLAGFQEIIKAFGIPQYKVKGREADDVIVSLINPDEESIVISTDKDFFQILSNDNASIYNPVKKAIVGREEVEERFGVKIEHLLDCRALIGDPSDGLPGVKGIGGIWAAWLVNNVIRNDTELIDVSSAQLTKINLLHDNLDDYQLMKELMRFKILERDELRQGRFEDRPKNLGELQERVIVSLQKYGFEKHLNNLTAFMKPFEMLWGKGE